jgi:hypothetical protein
MEDAKKIDPNNLTIENVKACIAFEDTGIKKSLIGLCDCWYQIALGNGKSTHEAAKEALDNLSQKIIQMRV